MLDRGADQIYLFNHFDNWPEYGGTMAEYRTMLSEGARMATVIDKPRRHIVTYRDLADHCGKHLKKNMMIEVIGVLVRSRWKNKEGEVITHTQVQATQVNLCMHRASVDFLDAALLLSAEQHEDLEVEEDTDDE